MRAIGNAEALVIDWPSLAACLAAFIAFAAALAIFLACLSSFLFNVRPTAPATDL